MKGRPALLQLDFDLAASHTVDIVPTPAEAVSEQFILAEVIPVDEKDIRVRGPLVSVSEDEMTYTVAIRPFHDRQGDFGRVKVHVTGETEFEVNEEMFMGVDGLRALDAAGPGTPTVAAGTLNVAAREFTADIVLAGSSVPGIDRDAVVGNVIKREGNFLTDSRRHHHSVRSPRTFPRRCRRRSRPGHEGIPRRPSPERSQHRRDLDRPASDRFAVRSRYRQPTPMHRRSCSTQPRARCACT